MQQIMQLRVSGLFVATTFVAAFFGMRGWWMSSRIPDGEIQVPVLITTAVAIYLGWKRSSGANLLWFSAATGFLSAAAIIMESMERWSRLTNPAFHESIAAAWATDVEWNAIAVILLTIVCSVVGVCVGLVTRWASRRAAEYTPRRRIAVAIALSLPGVLMAFAVQPLQGDRGLYWGLLLAFVLPVLWLALSTMPPPHEPITADK